MRNFWLIAKHEYLKIVRQKSFLVGTLWLPVMIIAVMIVAILASLGQRGDLPLGYVDYTGLLDAAVTLPLDASGKAPVAIQAFPDENAARAALEAERIQAYYIIPADYMQSGSVQLFYLSQRPGGIAQDDFVSFLRANLLAAHPTDIQQRIVEGSSITFRSSDGNQ